MALSKHVLLIHGWSADSGSMKDVARLLRENGFKTVTLLADYPSLLDEIRVEDVAARMERVIGELQVRDKNPLGAEFHIVVHSTGAYVAREWMADRFARGQKIPVQNFLMLAPANHGSPLATFGRSAFGRMFKGGIANGFQSGVELLHALELGSDYQQVLDLRDRLSKDGSTDTPYGEAANKVRPYVIVGAQPIDGTTILNQNGWDGTVRIAGANFDPRGMTVDFTQDPLKPRITGWKVRGPERTAFAVLPDRNHGTILQPTRNSKSLSNDPETRDRLRKIIVDALTTENAAGYRKVVAEWETISDRTAELADPARDDLREKILKHRGDRIPQRYHLHYQVIVDVQDDTPRPVDDFFLWLTAPTAREAEEGLNFSMDVSPTEIRAHRNVLQNVHVNRRKPHRRVLHLDRNELMGFYESLDHHRRIIDNGTKGILVAGVTVSAPSREIAYFSEDAKQGSGFIPLRAEDVHGAYDFSERFLRHYATHYMEIIVPRIAGNKVFTVKDYTG